MSLKTEAIKKFLTAARSLANQGLSKEAIEQFARNEFGQINELFQKQINNIFKRPASGIENIKIKDEVFDDTVIKLPVDDTGAPFNPKNPLKKYGKPKKDEGIMSQYKTIDDEVTQAEKDAFLDNFLANADRTYANFVTKAMKDIQKASKLEQEQMIKAISERSGMFRHLDDADADKIIKSADTSKPRNEKYTGGMVDVEPNLSDIGHGSDALMARTRLVAPNSQATTSTGLNYLLAEDNDNIRVPFSKGKLADAARRKFMKIAGGIGAGIGALKTGIFGLGEKAAPVVEKTVETVQETPQYFFDLVSKIKMFGKKSKVGPQERVNEFSYTGKNGDEYLLTEDISTGDARIVKDKLGGVRVGEDEVVDGIADRSVMEYKSGKGMADESTKGTPPDEYDEYKVEFDIDGTEADADILEESVKKEIIEEATETVTKKADGGRIGFNKGKLAIETGRKFLEKVFGKENFENIVRNDPELHRGMLEVVEMFRNRDKEGLKMYLQKFLPHMDDATVEDFIIGGGGTEGIQGQLLRLGSGRDYAGKIEMMKKLERNKTLRDLDVSKMKPNAEGGLITMLGE
jgi:hypothetical protein